jgi:hypothetical protein
MASGKRLDRWGDLHDLADFLARQRLDDYPVLTDRRNVTVIADEAHRSQHGFRERIERGTGEIRTALRITCGKGCRTLPSSVSLAPIEKEANSILAVLGSTSTSTT